MFLKIINFSRLLSVSIEERLERVFLCQNILVPFKPITTWRRIAGTRATKKDCKYFPSGPFPTKWLILWFYGFNFMKLSIRFAVPLFTLVSPFILEKRKKDFRRRGRISPVDFTMVSSRESIFVGPIDLARCCKINSTPLPAYVPKYWIAPVLIYKTRASAVFETTCERERCEF